MATQEIINIGTSPNDGAGDPLRVAFEKINNNFTSLFATFVNTSNTFTVGNTSNQLIFETPVNTFTMGQMYIYTADAATEESQTIQLFAQLNTLGDSVKFTGYGSTFQGNALSTFDMDISNGNIRILATPLTENPLFHFIASQNMWTGPDVPGVPLQLDGFVVDSVMATENNLTMTTENS